MKKLFQYTVFGLVLISLLMFISCKRSDVTDPDMHNNAGFFINLSGVANPGTLFVNQGGGWQNSYITMRAHFNDGSPVVGRSIIMKINNEFGTFPGNTRTAVITTNSQGTASIRYSVSHLAIDQIGSEQLIFIQAWMQADLYNVYDNVPIQLVTNMPDEDLNTLSYIVNGDTNFGSEGGAFDVYLYNSTGADTISYAVSINNSAMVTSSSTTGDTPGTVTFTVSENQTGTPRSATITVLAIAPDGVLGSPILINVTQGYSDTFSYAITAGDPEHIPASTGGQFTISLYNSTGTAVINFNISYTDPHGLISPTPGSGTTPSNITFNVSSGTAGDAATITFTQTSSPYTSHSIPVILD